MINNSQSSVGLVSFTQCKNDVTVLNEDVPTQILDANSERLYASFVIESRSIVTIFLGDRNAGNIERGIPLKPGGSFEINLSNLYRGKVSALCQEDGAKISWTECQ
jgi:hypothetical protein